jgi:predicted acetyltransferase
MSSSDLITFRRFISSDVASAVECGHAATGNTRAWWETLLTGPLLGRAETYVAEAAGRVVSFAAGHPLRVRLHGTSLPAIGVGSVTTHPAYRRRGLARALVERIMRSSRDRGVPLGLLRPLSHEVYRGAGWELADEVIAYRLNPADLPGDAAAQSSVRPAEAADLGRIMELYDLDARGHTLALERGRERWDALLASPDHELAVATGRGGEVDGYVLYRIGRPAEDDHLEPREGYKAGSRRWEIGVCELVCATPAARRGLWSLLGSYDHRHWTVTFATPRTRPLHPFLRHSYVDARIEPGYMLRLLDPASLLERLGAAGAGLRVRLSDPVFEENAGDLTLGGGDAPADPLELGVGRLAQLIAGYRSARELVDHGLVPAPSEATLRAAAEAFPPGSSWIPPVDGF